MGHKGMAVLMAVALSIGVAGCCGGSATKNSDATDKCSKSKTEADCKSCCQANGSDFAFGANMCACVSFAK